MNKEELDKYIYTKLIKNDKLIASAAQWGLVDNIENELDKHITLGNSSVEKLYRYINKDSQIHICECGKNVEFMSFRKGFRKFCSTSCSRKSKDTKQKFADTCIKKYGNENPFKTETVKNKTKKTNLEKYGVEYAFQSKMVKEKIKNTMLDRYVVTHNTGIYDVVLRQQISKKRNFAPKKYKTIFGNEIYYQSKPELEFIQVCEEENVFVENGPTVEYLLDDKKHYYHVDFKTNDKIVEIKSSHQYYKEALISDEIDAKNKSAEIYATNHNMNFFFLLDKTKKEYIKLMEEN